MIKPIFYQSRFLMFYIAIAHRTGESAEGTNTTSGGGGGNASNRTVNEGIKNMPIVEEHRAHETEELNEGKVMPHPKPKGK